jgi:hypothetical protein
VRSCAAARETSASSSASVKTVGEFVIFGPGSTDPDFADVRLGLESGGIRSVASGVSVPVERRTDLELSEQPPYGGRGGL